MKAKRARIADRKSDLSYAFGRNCVTTLIIESRKFIINCLKKGEQTCDSVWREYFLVDCNYITLSKDNQTAS